MDQELSDINEFLEERSKALTELLHSMLSLCHGTNERECIYVFMTAICHIISCSTDEAITGEWAVNLLKLFSEETVDKNLTFH